MHISSKYAKILAETNFQPREFPQSGSKAKDREKRTMASYALQTPPRVAHAKLPGPKYNRPLKGSNMVIKYTF